jgi:hypothetical protein
MSYHYKLSRKKRARWAFVRSGLEPDETPEWDVTAMCLDLGVGRDNEGYLALTDRRLFFVPDYDKSPARTAMITYGNVASINGEPGPKGTALATLTLRNGQTFHFVTGLRSVAMLKELAGSWHSSHGAAENR